jgi:hypothetical protein
MNEWGFIFNELIAAGTTGNEWIIGCGIDLHSKDEPGKTFDEDHRESVGWSCSC